jgi:uncharacterized membrane protein
MDAKVPLRHPNRYVQPALAWGRLFRTLSYTRSALWIVPFVAMVLVLLLAPLLRELDERLAWHFLGLEVPGAQALYQTVITLTLSFLVFTFGSLLVAIQVAGGQLTPRIIATTLLRDNVVRYSVGLFVFTLLFAVLSLNRLGERVPEIVSLLVAVLGIVCVATFLFLIDYAARLLRPVSIAARVGEQGLAVIESVYPDPVGAADARQPPAQARPTGPDGTARLVRHLGNSGILLAVDLANLAVLAERAGGVVELLPQVGDFVAQGEPLFALYAGAADLDDRLLESAVALGPERTLEQDPLFALRILVDIALKALSAAINDPTTAVLAIDQIQRLLRTVGLRDLQREVIADRGGRARVLYRTPDWEDYVHIACTEIRTCGAGNVQVARRLRAMLDHVAAALPAFRRAALRREREHLDAMIDACIALPDDRALARVADSQGLGAGLRDIARYD